MSSFRLYVVLACVLSSVATNPYTLPITKRTGVGLRRRQNSGAIGLGDVEDVAYSVQVKVGSVTIPLLFDTGSSDIWSVSTDCTSTSCGSLSGIKQISASSLTPTGVDVEIDYGDSAHSTFVSGMVYTGPITLAGVTIGDQHLAAVNRSTSVFDKESISGIFGAGFPISSVIFENLIEKTVTASGATKSSDMTDAFISALTKQGPMISRLINSGQLKQPMYTVTLERESFEVGGNVGQLTLGQLPDGVSNDSLTWVPVRLYREDQGGVAGPSSAPNEVYPSRWEVTIDDVLLNGKTLSKPSSANASIGYTALIDSGTSFLGGPKDVVSSIYSTVSGSGGAAPTSTSRSTSTKVPEVSCSDPIHLAYTIGGKHFPLDPRDFIGHHGEIGDCTAGSLLATDDPASGALMSWILGTPFMKSNLVAFYFGNLTHPSVDPPRIGFLSTVPSNADDLYREALSAAQAGDDLDLSSVVAPTTTFTAASTNSAGVAQAATGSAASSESTSSSGHSGGGSSGAGSSGAASSGAASSSGGPTGGATVMQPSSVLLIFAAAFGLFDW